jgi:hypothetical protein
MKFTFILFWFIGILVLLVLFQLAVTGDQRIILRGFENPLIKYSLPFFGINISIVLLLTPLLMRWGVITQDYYNSDRYTQARANFILLSLSAPGWIFLSIAIYYLAASVKPLLILSALLLFVYISSILTLLKRNK